MSSTKSFFKKMELGLRYKSVPEDCKSREVSDEAMLEMMKIDILEGLDEKQSY